MSIIALIFITPQTHKMKDFLISYRFDQRQAGLIYTQRQADWDTVLVRATSYKEACVKVKKWHAELSKCNTIELEFCNSTIE
jgi:hypothetical protein